VNSTSAKNQEELLRPGARSVLVEMRTGGSKPPLFLVHGIGGEVASFSDLARFLDPARSVWGFQQRAQDRSAEQNPASLEAMAASYLQELLAVQPPEKAILLGGYSFGAIVALEMAQQLTAKGYPVGLLAVIDESIPDPRSQVSRTARQWVRFFQNFPFWLWDEFFPSTARQHFARILKMARRHTRGTEPEQDDVDALFPVSHLPTDFRAICGANLRARRAYRAQVYAGAVTLFRARAQPLCCGHGVDLGWGKIALRRLAIRVIPGTHETILKEPHVKALAREVNAALARASGQVDARVR
jgi:thioesterase domain-containing protein